MHLLGTHGYIDVKIYWITSRFSASFQVSKCCCSSKYHGYEPKAYLFHPQREDKTENNPRPLAEPCVSWRVNFLQVIDTNGQQAADTHRLQSFPSLPLRCLYELSTKPLFWTSSAPFTTYFRSHIPRKPNSALPKLRKLIKKFFVCVVFFFLLYPLLGTYLLIFRKMSAAVL